MITIYYTEVCTARALWYGQQRWKLWSIREHISPQCITQQQKKNGTEQSKELKLMLLSLLENNETEQKKNQTFAVFLRADALCYSERPTCCSRLASLHRAQTRLWTSKKHKFQFFSLLPALSAIHIHWRWERCDIAQKKECKNGYGDGELIKNVERLFFTLESDSDFCRTIAFVHVRLLFFVVPLVEMKKYFPLDYPPFQRECSVNSLWNCKSSRAFLV